MSRTAIEVLSIVAVIIGGAISQKGLFLEEEGAVQLPPFEAVTQVFEQGEAAEDCETMAESLEALQPCLAIQDYIPARLVQTVTLPSRKSRPTTSDLAIDRIIRLEA